MNFLSTWLTRGNFIPHGYCLTWRPGLLWSTVGADAVIAASYYSIPFALVHFVRKRSDFSLNWIALLFSAFIFACGTTHVLAVWTVWTPDYGVETITKLVTAVVSAVTAIVLWPMLPRAIRIPSVAQLQSSVAQLEREVTQRRSVEADLADLQESLTITLASIGAAFISTDREGLIVRINPAAEAITGWPRATAVGQRLDEVLKRSGVVDATNPVDVLIGQNRMAETASRITIVARNGMRLPIEVNAAVIHAPDGGARGMAVVFRDMSRLEQAQTESQQLASLVASSGDAIIGADIDGSIVSWNHGAEEMFGYTASEIVGQPLALLMPPERLSEGERTLARLRQGLRTPPFDTVRRRRDGTLLHVSVTVSPILDSMGAVIGASKIARDITQQKRNEQLRLRSMGLEAQNRQIQESNRLKSAFLANMSHELRTPLNAIIGFADLLHLGQVPHDSPKFQEFLGHIRSSGRHLLQLINDVLDLSKVEAGKYDFFPEPVDLRRLVDDAVGVLRNAAAAKRVSISVDVDPTLDDILLDPARLKQVLYNYISNAIKFTPHDGAITVRAQALGGGEFRLEVEDTGIGIAPSDLQRLFVDFQQLDTGYRKEHPGTGLGLALTKRLVQAQGGRVGVQSTLGVGSTFYAVLPRVAVPAAGAGAAHMASPTAATVTAPVAGTLVDAPRVLMIEDNARDQATMAAALADAGYAVDVAADGTRAMLLAAEHAYAAITLDLLLPDCSSIQVLSTLRSAGPNRHTPVVVVTMAGGHAPLAGFRVSDVLLKPLRTSQLQMALRKAGVLDAPRRRVLVVDAGSKASAAAEIGAPQSAMAADAMALLCDSIEQLGAEPIVLPDGAEALARIDEIEPDAVILDLLAAAVDAYALLDHLRRQPQWRRVPVFIWTAAELDSVTRARLTSAATAIVDKGRGGLEQLLGDLRTLLPPPMIPGPV